MRRLLVILFTMVCISAFAQKPVRIYSTYAESYAATQLQEFLAKGGCNTTFGGRNLGRTIYVGLTVEERGKYKPIIDSLRDDGFFILGDGRNVRLYGKGEKGTLYAVYAFLEMLGYRLYTPEAMMVPDVSSLKLPTCRIVSNPAFEWREVSYYYPNHNQLYADWHHLHTQADRNRQFGMFVHTFAKLVSPSDYFDEHPEYFSLNNGHRSRDGQLCLSNPEVLEAVCNRLSLAMIAQPIDGAPYNFKYWSVSPNDNYNVCECDNCRRLDSLYGGPSGTLIWFVNQVARRFPDKTIATLAYQYTRKAPTSDIRPNSNVLIMLCPIEAGRQTPITETDPAFRKDMEDWSLLTNNLFLWDYVVQFRNFWNPFPNLHVLQPNLQYFRDNGTRMMFEQASGANNITSWMDIRCYMIAKLLWNPDADMDSIMDDFYYGYYGVSGRYVKEIIDSMTMAVQQGGRTLDIYGYPVDAAETYLSPERRERYWELLHDSYQAPLDSAQNERLLFFEAALVFAELELSVYEDTASNEALLSRLGWLTKLMLQYHVPNMMEMGIAPSQYDYQMSRYIAKRGMPYRPCTLRKPATAPYNTAGLTDGKAGIMDYRHNWLGFWGDTLDAVIDLGEPTEIHEVSLDLYCYPLSWIFRPQIIEVYLSDDGLEWKKEGLDCPLQSEVLATPSIYQFKNEFPTSRTTRYVRVVAVPLPKIPDWHRAAGQKPWIFTDEIIVR